MGSSPTLQLKDYLLKSLDLIEYSLSPQSRPLIKLASYEFSASINNITAIPATFKCVFQNYLSLFLPFKIVDIFVKDKVKNSITLIKLASYEFSALYNKN